MGLFSLLVLALTGVPAVARAAVRGSAAERVLSAAAAPQEQLQKLAPGEAAPRFAESTSQDVAQAQLGLYPATIGIILVSSELLARPPPSPRGGWRCGYLGREAAVRARGLRPRDCGCNAQPPQRRSCSCARRAAPHLAHPSALASRLSSLLQVLKLVNAVASGFTEMVSRSVRARARAAYACVALTAHPRPPPSLGHMQHKQKSSFLTDAATEELADLRREAAKEASELTALFDGAVGDLNTRYKDTVADLAVDMINDKVFLTAENSNYILRVIRAELELKRAGGGAKGGVHTLEELELLYSAAQIPNDREKNGPLQIDIFYSLLSAALRREYDAVFGWTAAPADTVLIKALTPAFGDLAHKIVPEHVEELKGKIAARAQFDESLEANSDALRHIKHLDDAYGRSLEEVFELVGDRKKEEREELAHEVQHEMVEQAFDTTMKVRRLPHAPARPPARRPVLHFIA